MSGETEANVSGWTTDTLHAHLVTMLEERETSLGIERASFLRLIDERLRLVQDHQVQVERRLDDRHANSLAATYAALAAQERSLTQALEAADKAVFKAEASVEKRFDGVNEFRATLADQQRTLMPRPEAEVLFKGVSDRLDRLAAELVAQQAERHGAIQATTLIGPYMVAIISVAVTIFLHYTTK